jgi:6-phosphogluconolactonase
LILAGDTVRIAKDAEALMRDAAEVFAAEASDVAGAGGLFSVALAGGSTPHGLYTLLAGEPAFRERVPWTRIHFFWGDERHVPPDHPESNYRLAHETMLSRVGVPEDHIHRIRTELPDAAAAAGAYEETLRELAGGRRPRPSFDLVLLGMGSDGHTASLFPGTDGLRSTTRLVVAHWVERLGSHRITLTVPALSSAVHVVFLVSGAEKAATLRDVLMVEAPTEALPASLIRPMRGGRLTWLVDQDAARLLEPPHSGGLSP